MPVGQTALYNVNFLHVWIEQPLCVYQHFILHNDTELKVKGVKPV